MGKLDDPDEFFHKAERLQRQLVNQGTQMPNSAMQALVVTKLPQSSHTLVTVLNTRDFTYDEVKSQASHSSASTSNAPSPNATGGRRWPSTKSGRASRAGRWVAWPTRAHASLQAAQSIRDGMGAAAAEAALEYPTAGVAEAGIFGISSRPAAG